MAHDKVPNLKTLWVEENPGKMSCCVCSRSFHSDPLIRTFRLRQAGLADDKSKKCSRTVEALGEEIILYDRHQKCVPKSGYVAISHTWDEEISVMQDKGESVSQREDVRGRLFKSVFDIYHSLQKTEGIAVEVWQDYVSVPQWTQKAKDDILPKIPSIFRDASFTLVCMKDISSNQVRKLQHGAYPGERFEAVTEICAARWYSRVWTYMEFARSRSMKVMTNDYHIIPDSDDVLVRDLGDAWGGLALHHGNHYAAETRAHRENKLVPWNLGYPPSMNDRSIWSFGFSFGVLSKRGCRSSKDFLFALAGLVLENPPDSLLPPYESAISKVMKLALEAGDYSPLLMPPLQGGPQDRRGWWKGKDNAHYNDVFAFGLGRCGSIPKRLAKPYQTSGSSDATLWTLQLERIGTIEVLEPQNGPHGTVGETADIIHQILSMAGPDVDRFVNTIGPRFFNLGDKAVKTILSDQQCRQSLSKILHDWCEKSATYADSSKRRQPTEQIIADLNLAVPPRLNPKDMAPLDFIKGHGTTIHSNSPCVIGIKCSTCQMTFAYKAALFKPIAKVRSAVAYRIPGLKYWFTREDGAGILVKGQEIVGRLVWASPACIHRPMDTIKVKLADLPLPAQSEEWRASW